MTDLDLLSSAREHLRIHLEENGALMPNMRHALDAYQCLGGRMSDLHRDLRAANRATPVQEVSE